MKVNWFAASAENGLTRSSGVVRSSKFDRGIVTARESRMLTDADRLVVDDQTQIPTMAEKNFVINVTD